MKCDRPLPAKGEPAPGVAARMSRLTAEQRVLLQQRLQKTGKATASAPASAPRPLCADAARPPISFAQCQMWLLDQLALGTELHNIGLHFRLEGPLVQEAMAGALTAIVRRHAPLRTTFDVQDGLPSPVCQGVPSEPLPVIDLMSLPAGERDAGAARLAAAELRRAFALHRELPFRARLLRLGEQVHVLVLTVHHIAFDRWSTGVLLRELSALYSARVRGHGASLPELPIQYTDFAAWQREHFTGEVLDAELAYWKTQLAGAPAWLELPTDRPRPAVAGQQSGRARLLLPEALCASLFGLAREEQTTLFIALLAGYLLLLKRHAGQDDLVVGTAVAGRERPELAGLIGVFINTLPLRVSLADETLTFRQLVGRVRDVAVSAFAHQALPFELLVEKLNPQRRSGSPPVFQTLISFHSGEPPVLALDRLMVNALPVDSGTIDHDLRLSLAPVTRSPGGPGDAPSGHIATLRYRADLFDLTTIERMLGHYRQLLESGATEPDRRLGELSALTAAERHQLLVTWNATAVPFPAEVGVHQLVEAQAARSPHAVAVAFEGQHLTYQELNTAANRLAQRLDEHRVGPDMPVALFLDRSLELVVGLLAILKAGGAYLPIDPDLPRDRIAFLLQDAQPAAALVKREQVGRLPTGSIPLVIVEKDASPEPEPPSNLAVSVTPNHLAYVLYTSGSTGRPKGVEVEHRALSNLLLAMRALLQFGPADVLVAATPLSFDIAGLEIWLPLISGARLVLAPRQVGLAGAELAQLLDDSAATVFQATPVVWRILFDAGYRGNSALRALVGGEAVPADLADQLAQATQRAWNVYGPTETTIWSTAQLLTLGERPVTIGHPIANTTVYVLDAQLAPVPIGVPGEIHIGGAGLARGYRHRPELTAQSFGTDPFSAAPGSRLYKTGDLGRFLPDGRIEFLGRTDHQVKLRGLRIELGEIECVLRQHPLVREAVVATAQDGAGEPRLVAYVVAGEAPLPAASELRRYLQSKLPDYMVPGVFVELPGLPLLPSGKVDRKALPAAARAGCTGEFVGPRDTLELTLVRLWEELLSGGPVGVRDDFHARGGHSLLAVRLMARIKERLGRTLPLSALLQGGTVEALAQRLREQDDVPPRSGLVALQPTGRGRPCFFVHPRGGTVFCYLELARHLGPDRPVYGLVARGVEQDEQPGEQIDEMAARYIEALCAVQPEGPYVLGGWSFGGLVAFAMAQRLCELGHRVELLALLDCPPPLRPRGSLQSTDEARLLVALASDYGVKLAEQELRELRPGARLDRALVILHAAGVMPPGFGRDQLRRFLTVSRAHARAAEQYEPRVYSGPLTLFWAAEQAPTVGDSAPAADRGPSRGWNTLSSQPVSVHMVPGNHFSMLKAPHVQLLAERLRSCLLTVSPLAGVGSP